MCGVCLCAFSHYNIWFYKSNMLLFVYINSSCWNTFASTIWVKTRKTWLEGSQKRKKVWRAIFQPIPVLQKQNYCNNEGIIATVVSGYFDCQRCQREFGQGCTSDRDSCTHLIIRWSASQDMHTCLRLSHLADRALSPRIAYWRLQGRARTWG